jgi:hypothetical protein
MFDRLRNALELYLAPLTDSDDTTIAENIAPAQTRASKRCAPPPDGKDLPAPLQILIFTVLTGALLLMLFAQLYHA